jgi:hypothetical protein
VTTIGNSAFFYCTSLASVIINATTPPTLGSSAFNGNASDRKIYVPSASVGTYKNATNWITYKDDIVAIPVVASGDCGTEGHESEVTWEIIGTSPNYTLIISGTGEMKGYDPGEQPWKTYNGGITTVVIGNGVTNIGKNICFSLFNIFLKNDRNCGIFKHSSALTAQTAVNPCAAVFIRRSKRNICIGISARQLARRALFALFALRTILTVRAIQQHSDRISTANHFYSTAIGKRFRMAGSRDTPFGNGIPLAVRAHSGCQLVLDPHHFTIVACRTWRKHRDIGNDIHAGARHFDNLFGGGIIGTGRKQQES